MRRRGRERGAALVEMAVALPLLLLALVGATDFGRMAYVSVAVSNAAAAGARYGAHSSDSAGNLDGMKSAARNDMGSHGTGRDLTVETERYCTCAPSDSATSCESSCPVVAGYPTQPRMFVRVRVASTFDMLFKYPLLPKSVTISRQVLMRAQ